MTEILNTLGGLVAALGNTQSALALKEQLALLSLRLADAQAEHARLANERDALALQVRDLQTQKGVLQAQARQMELKYEPHANPSGYACEACGSTLLRRTGSRPAGPFGRLGAKEALYTCAECAHVSSFFIDLG